jgi:hypothetical protein
VIELVATAFIILHEGGGAEIDLNPAHIVALHTTREGAGQSKNKLVTSGVNCVLALSNGKIISVIETCDKVRELMEGAK